MTTDNNSIGNGENHNMFQNKVGCSVAVIFLFLITLIVFIYSVQIRKPWMGSLYSHHHINLTAHTLFFVKNWYREGALNLKLASINSLNSIETSRIKRRPVYVSWPPGHLLPIYIISKIIKREPSSSLIMKYNLFNHFFIAFFLSLTVFFFLVQIKYNYFHAVILSVIPIFIVLLLPGNLWYLQMTYQNPQAVILPFVLFIFLEVIRDYRINRTFNNTIYILQFIIFFYGVLTAYLFYILGFVVYIKRILNNEIRKKIIPFLKDSLKFWAPGLIGSVLFMLQLFLLNALKQTISRGLHRSSFVGGGDIWISRFWDVHLPRSYGQVGKYLIWASLVFLIGALFHTLCNIFRRIPNNDRINKMLSLAGIILFPCFLHIYLLGNLAWYHGFTALKFSLPLAVLPFILIPLLIFQFVNPGLGHFLYFFEDSPKTNRRTLRTIMSTGVVVLLLILSLLYTFSQHKHYKRYFDRNSAADINEKKIQPYIFLGENTGYKDIVFSPGVEVNPTNKVPLIYTMNMVYKIYSIHDIYKQVKDINQDCIINIFLKSSDNHAPYIRAMTGQARHVLQSGDWKLLKIKKVLFLSIYRKLRKKNERKQYFQERKEFDRAKNELELALRDNNLYKALVFNDRILDFIEKNNASPYNLRFYLLKIAILNRFNNHRKARKLAERLEKEEFIYIDEPLWGWDPNPWTLDMVLTDKVAWQFLRKQY